jgi:hypothetical protein
MSTKSSRTHRFSTRLKFEPSSSTYSRTNVAHSPQRGRDESVAELFSAHGGAAANSAALPFGAIA